MDTRAVSMEDEPRLAAQPGHHRGSLVRIHPGHARQVADYQDRHQRLPSGARRPAGRPSSADDDACVTR